MKRRLWSLVLSDIRFQIKYGFYFLYLFLVILYIFALSLIPVGNLKHTVSILLILSDPAAMGMFFMGAVVLLEKSQRVLNSLAVSPVTTGEYILSKLFSFGFISLIAGFCIGLAGNIPNLFFVLISVVLLSFIFSLCGLIVGAGITSLNQYILATMPFEIIGFFPAICYLFLNDSPMFLFHPCAAMLYTMSGNRLFFPLMYLIMIFWILILYKIASHLISKMFRQVGGVRL